MAGNSNSGNRHSDKPISDAIRMELEEEIKDPKTKKMTKKHRRLAKNIVWLAVVKKDKWAMEQCMDRIEGRPQQSVDSTIHYNPMEDLFGDILAASKARSVPDAPETTH